MTIVTVKKSEINDDTFSKIDLTLEGGDVFKGVISSAEFVVKPDFSETKTKLVYSTAGRGVQTIKTLYSGDPVLKYNPEHLNDTTFDYEPLAVNVLAGPKFPDFVSQAEWQAAKRGS